MNRQQLRQEAEERIQDQDNALASDNTINSWINKAVRHLGTFWNWTFLKKRATVVVLANTDTIALPVDFRALTKVQESGNSLHSVTDRWLQDNIAPTATGTPEYFTDGGFSQTNLSAQPVRVLRVAPKPLSDTTLNITYLAQTPTLAADGDFPPFPTDFDEAIISWVLARYYQVVGDFTAVTENKNNFREELTRLISAYSDFGQEAYPRIQLDTEDNNLWLS